MHTSFILYINARFVTQPLTGVQRYAFECCMQLKRLLPGVILLRPFTPHPLAWSMELETNPMGRFTGHAWEQIDLPMFLWGKQNCGLLNLCNTGPLFVKRQWVTIHDLSFYYYRQNYSWTFSMFYNFLLPRIAKRSLHVFTMSRQVKKELIQEFHLPEKLITVTGNGLPALYEHVTPVDPGLKEKIILTVGTISRRKNIQALIDAFVESPLHKEYQLVIAGGRHPAFARSAYAGDARITWLNAPDDIALQQEYRRAEIVVSLSLYEGFGIPVLEALSSGCKVICSDIDVYRELYSGYVYFCDPHEHHAIIETLSLVARMKARLIDIDELRRRFSYQKTAWTMLDHITNSSI